MAYVGFRRMLGGVALAAAFAALMPRPGGANELIPFKVAVSATVVSVLPIYFADGGGFYKNYGLDASIISTEGGTRGVQVLLSGEIQAMHVGLSPVVAADGQGANVRAVASTTNTLPITIFATKKSNPPLPKGARVGISTVGSETDIALTVALKAMGMSRDDVQITQIGGTSQRFAAMMAGRIDAAPLLEPAITAAKQKGFAPVYDLSAAHTPWIFDSVAVTTDFIRNKPDVLQRFLKAYVEGAYWALANPDKAKVVIARSFKTKDQAVIDAAYDGFKQLMPLDARPSVEGAKNVIAQLKATGVTISSDNPKDYLDFGPLDTLQKAGFFAEMQKKYGIH